MIPNDLFTVLVFAFGIGLGLFLAWVVWRFHIRPSYFRRREGPVTYTPPIKASHSQP
jgi:hypothetical protein